MGQPLIVRYNLLRKPGKWRRQPVEEMRTPLQDWYKGYEVRVIGTVVVLDLSGNSYCEEIHTTLYECRSYQGLAHPGANGRYIRSSRLTVTYGFYPRGLRLASLPANHQFGCPVCLDEPHYIMTADEYTCECEEMKQAWVPVTSCASTDHTCLQRLAPEGFYTTAEFDKRPYKEELIAAAMHPDRRNLLASVLDIEELKDFSL